MHVPATFRRVELGETWFVVLGAELTAATVDISITLYTLLKSRTLRPSDTRQSQLVVFEGLYDQDHCFAYCFQADSMHQTSRPTLTAPVNLLFCHDHCKPLLSADTYPNRAFENTRASLPNHTRQICLSRRSILSICRHATCMMLQAPLPHLLL